MKKMFFIALLLLPFTAISAASYDSDLNNDGESDQWFIVGNRGYIIELKTDNDYDGRFDYLARYAQNGKPQYEEFDYNYDGEMDTFNYYTKGSLERQEIDSNFDGKIDIWVYLYNSVYILRYEMDTDFDGKADLIRNYSD